MEVRVKKLHKDAIIPEYQTKGAAGFDLHAFYDWAVPSKSKAIIKTGIAIEIPENFELQVRSRSGLAASHSIFVLNSPGTIDSDYRGEIKVILENLSDKDFIIKHGDRIAQGVIAPVKQVSFVEVEELSNTERGEGGFGSTKI